MAVDSQGIGVLEWRWAERNILKLWEGEQNLARLEYGKWSRQKVQAIIAGANYSLNKEGFLIHRYYLRTVTFGEIVATVHPRLWRPGSIEFADGNRYLYRSMSWRGKLWKVTDPQGNPLLQMELRSGGRKEAEVRWLEKGRANHHSLQLTALLMYMVLLFQEQAATAAGVGAGVGAGT